MRGYWKGISLLVFITLAYQSFGQVYTSRTQCLDDRPEWSFPLNEERGCNCFDGIDNNGNGQTDRDDPSCNYYFAVVYGLEYLGAGSDCSVNPPISGSAFSFVGTSASQQNTADTQSKIAVGDVDGDGIPDAVITSKWNKNVRVVATSNNQPDGSSVGTVKSQFGSTGNLANQIFADVPGQVVYEHEVLIADIDGDGKAEIFAIVSGRKTPNHKPDKFFLIGFRYAPATLVPMFKAVELGTKFPGMLGIADFDGDGKAEIYIKDRIFAAESGKLLAEGNAGSTDKNRDWVEKINGGPVAVNIDRSTPNLELVVGNLIYQVPNLSARNFVNMTVWRDMNTAFPAQAYSPKRVEDVGEYGDVTFSSTSVADWDLDGEIDVFITGATGGPNGRTAVFYWNVHKNTLNVYHPADQVFSDGWPWGTSRINLGDTNGDGWLNATYIAGNQLFNMSSNQGAGFFFTPTWGSPRIINDSKSGIVAVTVYDFENDGIPEIVYRDSQQLVVIDGSNPNNVHWATQCQSHTMTEGPIIADVNGDGATDICVPCYTSNNANSFKIDADIQQQALGQVRLFFSSENAWLPTRKVWNQPGYFVVNINDDLTIPFPQLDQSTIFPGDPCFDREVPNRPFNVYLNQVPNIGPGGCPIFPAPDLAFFGDPLDPDREGDPDYNPVVRVIPPICGDLGIGVIFNIINSGDLPITDNVPVSFFNGDPENDPDAQLLHSDFLSIVNLGVNQTYTSPPVSFNGPGTPFMLYIVLNNDGAVVPLDPSRGVVTECDIANNVESVFVDPTPIDLVVEKIRDNEKCEDTNPNTGELLVSIFRNGVQDLDYSRYAFQWFYADENGQTLGPVEDALGGNTDRGIELPTGFYVVQVTNTQKGCVTFSLPAEILDGFVQYTIQVENISDQTVCDPPNGELRARVFIEDTELTNLAGFTFEWFDINLTPLGITGPTASNLAGPLNYAVSVVSSETGCTTLSPGFVDGPQIPEEVRGITVQNVQDCALPTSGSVTAEVYYNAILQDPSRYTFNWYLHNIDDGTRGSILPDIYGTGRDRTGLPIGWYEVEAIDNISNCVTVASGITEVVDSRIYPEVVVTQQAPQTSCDPENPNGIAFAEVFLLGQLQNPADYTFEWFVGDNTDPAFAHTNTQGVNGRIAEGMQAGITYTVKVTNALNCFELGNIIIDEILLIPEVTLTAFDNNICDPDLAATNFTGRVEADVVYNGNPLTDFTGFTIQWFDGGNVNVDPVIVGATGDILPNLREGYYSFVITHNATTCASIPLDAFVEDIQILPVIEMAPTPQTNCDDNFNGALSASIDETAEGGSAGVTTGYTFTWYRGTDVTIEANQIGTGPSITGLKGDETYTVLVVNNATGCSNTWSEYLPDNSVLPLIALDKIDNGICDPALTNPPVQFGGSVTATVTFNGAPVVDFSGYTLTWYNGTMDTDPVNGTSTSTSLINLNEGDYAIRAVNNALGCVSDVVSIKVEDIIDLPVVVVDLTPSTNCDPDLPNGALEAFVDVGGVNTTSGYTFNWFSGAEPSGTNLGNASLLSNQNGGALYTVLVTNLATGCQAYRPEILPDESILPVVTLTPTNNTICDEVLGYNGAVNAVVTYGGMDVTAQVGGIYSINWFDGDSSSDPGFPGINGTSLTGINGGYYSARAFNSTLGCLSDLVITEVEDVVYTPVIVMTPTNQTSCDVNQPNGAIEMGIDESSIGGSANRRDGYSTTWYNNVEASAPEVPNTNNFYDITNLAGNEFYTVYVRNDATGCENAATLFLPEELTIPVVAAAIVEPSTSCILPDGAVDAFVTIGVQGHHWFYWLKENPNEFTTDPQYILDNPSNENPQTMPGVGLFTGLDPAVYTVVAFNWQTNCFSQPESVEVVLDVVENQISIVPVGLLPSDCDEASGVLEASVSGGTGSYDLFWYRGGPINSGDIRFFGDIQHPEFDPNTPMLEQPNVGIGTYQLTNLTSGLYTGVVFDLNTGCGNYEVIFLPFDDPHGIADDVTNSNICPYDIGNGVVEADLILPVNNLSGLTASDYYTRFYSGENPSPANLIGNAGNGVFPNSFDNLAPGRYLIEIAQDRGGSDCPVYKVVEVGSDALPPLLTLVGDVKSNTACDVDSAADGEITLNISQRPDDIVPNLTYTMVVSPGVAGFPQGGYEPGDDVSISGLGPNSYVFTVEASNGCVAQRFFTINDQPAVAELVDGDVLITDAELCLPDGSIEVNSIAIIGGPADNIADYRFDWFNTSNTSTATPIYSAQGTVPSNFGGEVLSNATLPDEVGPGFYWVVATKTSGTGGIGCFSAPFQARIQDNSVNPTISLTPFVNTACDENFEGAIEVLVQVASGPGVGGNYTFEWLSAPTGTIDPGTGQDNVPDRIEGLEDGLYRIRAVNDVTGCAVVGESTILPNQQPIFILSVNERDQDFCFPNGEAEVLEVSLNGVDPTDLNDFVFQWFQGGTQLLDENDDPILVPALADLGPGTYSVIAVRTAATPPGSGCKSAPFPFFIQDISIDPSLTLSAIENQACSPFGTGEITALANTNNGMGNTDFSYYLQLAGNPVTDRENATGDETFIELLPGLYAVRVVDDVTQCERTASITVQDKPLIPNGIQLVATDQLICFPDGSVEVVSINPYTLADYTYTWYAGSENLNNDTPIGGAAVTPLLDRDTYPDMGIGTYYVIATKNSAIPNQPGDGCSSAPVTISVKDLSVVPGLGFAFTPNSSCDESQPNGTIIATAFERNVNFPEDYDLFAWLYNDGPLEPVVVPGGASPQSTLDNVREGLYTLTVRNEHTGCEFTSSVVVNLNQTISEPNIIEVLVNNPEDCFPTGDATVTRISIGGGPEINDPFELDNSFTYIWYNNAFDPANIRPEVGRMIVEGPGKFFVVVSVDDTKCESKPKEVNILTDEIVYPNVRITQNELQIACDPDINTAVLFATADGGIDSSNPVYTFTWYEGLDAPQGVFLRDGSLLDDIRDGHYSVNVFNAATNCEASAYYIVPDDAPRFIHDVSLNSQDNTLCVGQNGIISIRVLPKNGYPLAFNYTVDVYNGANPDLTAAPDYPNLPMNPQVLLAYNLNDLAVGTYTVRVVDNNTGCVVVESISVNDGSVNPQIAMQVDNPLTNCDPERPNGQLSATADGGQVSGYTFRWYAGTVITDPANPIHVGDRLIARTVGSYIVQVTNNFTGCVSELVGTITDGTVTPPSPTPEVIAHQTSCIEPNGWVTASVDGNVVDYTFNWYEGTSVTGQHLFTGVNLRDIFEGFYTVTATDRVTGCVSAGVSIEVLDQRVLPLIIFDIVDSGCDRATGAAEAIVINDVLVNDISWTETNGNFLTRGVGLYGVFAGDYIATVTTFEGCVGSEVATIRTEITSYNAISANGDGLNDVFEIDCITNFPNNNVKIFNRAGVLVYEADGYNNSTIVFDGKGIRGAYALGDQVPDGTYFYIIDKRDGSKPKTGYLELIR